MLGGGAVVVRLRSGIRDDCNSFRLLPDCAVEGSYGFAGMTTKQQVFVLDDADEVKANLPLTGAQLVASLGADLQRGTTLDVAMVMIGKLTTTRGAVGREQLAGQCAGATHFVRGATVSAFAMTTGTKAAPKFSS